MKSTEELKFVLNLLSCPDYRSLLTAGPFKNFKGKNKVCQDLSDRGIVEFSREIAAVKILPAGRELLKVDQAESPLTTTEFKALEKISQASGKMTPGQITTVKASEREGILQALGDRGLIETESKIKRTKAEVWLTPRGIEYLRDEYNPSGRANISLDLLKQYLNFLRKTLHSQPEPKVSSAVETSITEPAEKPSDAEILQLIKQLDFDFGTKNYLPIFHLRAKLQPPLTRQELDETLYRLQKMMRSNSVLCKKRLLTHRTSLMQELPNRWVELCSLFLLSNVISLLVF